VRGTPMNELIEGRPSTLATFLAADNGYPKRGAPGDSAGGRRADREPCTSAPPVTSIGVSISEKAQRGSMDGAAAQVHAGALHDQTERAGSNSDRSRDPAPLRVRSWTKLTGASSSEFSHRTEGVGRPFGRADLVWRAIRRNQAP
jgi:hypothetical protein